jgi:hypothetical protein
MSATLGKGESQVVGRDVYLSGKQKPNRPRGQKTAQVWGFTTQDLDMDLMQRVNHFYLNDPTVMACKQVLMWFLFREDVKVKWGSKKTTRDEFTRYLRKFFVDIIDSYWQFGFVPWTEIVTECGQSFPHVLPFGTYRVQRQVMPDYTVKFRVFPHESTNSNRAGEDDLGLYIETVDGYEPTYQGFVKSKMASLLAEKENADLMQEYSMRAAAMASNPPRYLERQLDPIGNARTPGGVKDSRAMALFNKRRANKRKNLEDEMARAETAAAVMNRSIEENQRRMNPNGHRKRQRFNYKTGELENVDELYAGGVFPVPTGYHITAGTQSREPTHTIQWVEFLQRQICGVMGVPYSMLFHGTGQMVRDAAVGQQNMMNMAIVQLKNIARIIGESILNKMMMAKDREVIESKLLALNLIEKPTKENLDEIDEETNNAKCSQLYHVEFGHTANITLQEFEKLYTMHLLKPDTQAGVLSNIFGIPRDMFDLTMLSNERQFYLEEQRLKLKQMRNASIVQPAQPTQEPEKKKKEEASTPKKEEKKEEKKEKEKKEKK